MTSLLKRLVAWILAPVEFPGKWPVIEAPVKRYNKEMRSELHGRVTKQ